MWLSISGWWFVFYFHNIWDNPSLANIFSERLKPPTRFILGIIEGIEEWILQITIWYVCICARVCLPAGYLRCVCVYLTIDMYIIYLFIFIYIYTSPKWYIVLETWWTTFGFCDHCAVITSFIVFPDYHCKNHPEWLRAFEWIDSMHGFLWSCLLLGIWKRVNLRSRWLPRIPACLIVIYYCK